MDTSKRSGRGRQSADVVGLARDNILLEWYRYPPGPKVVLPTHAHEDYQLNLNVDLPAGVHYRGEHLVVPAGSLTIIMPGEAHTPDDPGDRTAPSVHLLLEVGPEAVRSAAAAVTHRAIPGLPLFHALVVDDPELIRRFARLHAMLSGRSSALDRDVRLLTLLTDLVERHGNVAATRPMPSSHRAIRHAREYLHDNLAVNVSLVQLSRVSGLSPYSLTRSFTASVGMPPHAYQIQLRIQHAKRLLLAGRSATDAGLEAGFFDLSHFTRHFRRYIGVPPGVYARRTRSDRRSPAA